MKTTAMTCERARDAALLRESGELDAAQQMELTTHLAECNACRLYGEETSWLMRTVRESVEVPGLPLGAVARIRAAAKPRTLRFRRSSWWLAAAATLFAVLGGGWWFARQAPMEIAEAAPSRDMLIADVLDTELDEQIMSLRTELAQLIGETHGDWLPEDDDSLARQLLALEELTS